MVGIAQLLSGYGYTSSFLNLTFSPAVASGSVVVAVVVVEGITAVESDLTFLLDGQPVTPAANYSSTANPVPGSIIFAVMPPSASAGAQTIRVDVPAVPAWWLTVYELTGVAYVEDLVVPAPVSDFGTGPLEPPSTPAWTAADPGLAIAAMFASGGDTGALVEPAGWTVDAGASDTATQFQVVSRAIAGAGAEAAEPWTNDAFYWNVVLWPFYDLGLRVPDAQAVASSASGAALPTEGSSPPPNPTLPYQPAVNPIPPDPGGIPVPLAPWVPGPGPYRRGSSS